MFRHGPTILTLTVALAGTADSTTRILNWNIDRGQHFKGIVAAMRKTRPELCILQEVDFGARRTKGEDVAKELAETFGMNYTFAPEFRDPDNQSGFGNLGR